MGYLEELYGEGQAGWVEYTRIEVFAENVGEFADVTACEVVPANELLEEGGGLRGLLFRPVEAE